MLPYSSSTPMMDARPYSGCPIPPATRLLTDKDMREYLMKVPTIYAEAVAEGPHRSKEVAWMQRVGLLLFRILPLIVSHLFPHEMNEFKNLLIGPVLKRRWQP